MPKKSKSTPQPTLFRREIPKMPEGYYSSGPNPNLRKFVEEHATPYDPATDEYEVPPFDQPITTTKSSAIFNMHTYWSKKPHDAIQQYIQHYTKPGDLVLDPFCGSGGTALAALLDDRTAIAIDLSPAATFITKNYCAAVDVDELQSAFEELKKIIKPEIDWLYETRCDNCGGRATTIYTVYSSVFQCPRCLSKFPLFDCVELPALTHSGKDKTIRVCPICRTRGIQEEIKSNTKKFGSVPVLVNYICEDGCKPKRRERRQKDLDPKKREFFEKYDLQKIKEIESNSIKYWYPKADLSKVIPYRMLYKKDFRPTDATNLIDFYTKRNLWAISSIVANIKNINKYSDQMLFALSAILFGCSRMYLWTEKGQHGFISGTYYIPQINREINVWKQFLDKLNSLPELQQLAPLNPGFIISTESATHMSIPSNSVDFIFTDPPYGGKIQYGELNYFWEAWLGFNSPWYEEEIIVNEARGKNEVDWADLMKLAAKELFRVLKPGRWLSLCYHDTSEGTWALIQDIMAEAGFISEQSNLTLFIDSIKKTFNQYTADKVTKRDLVINFRKPREGEVAAKVLLTGEEDPSSFSEKAQIILREALDRNPGISADHLYDELVSRMVRKGLFERHNFDELLRTVAEETGGRWYLLETADQVDETENKKESVAATRLEAFMMKYFKSHTDEIGVHYSNLFEEYLPIGDKPRRLLQDWLPEFFYKTEDGTWRPSLNEDERQVKLSLRLSGELRHIKRFASALRAGVPPSERDRPSNAGTLVEWIYQCRRSGLYELGRVLYERGGLRFDNLSEALQLQVEEDYQICVRRGTLEKTKTRKTKKKAQPGLFEETDA